MEDVDVSIGYWMEFDMIQHELNMAAHGSIGQPYPPTSMARQRSAGRTNALLGSALEAAASVKGLSSQDMRMETQKDLKPRRITQMHIYTVCRWQLTPTFVIYTYTAYTVT